MSDDTEGSAKGLAGAEPQPEPLPAASQSIAFTLGKSDSKLLVAPYYRIRRKGGLPEPPPDTDNTAALRPGGTRTHDKLQ